MLELVGNPLRFFHAIQLGYSHLAPSVELEAVNGMAASWQAKVAKATKDRASVTAESGILDAVAEQVQNGPTDSKTSTGDSEESLAATA